MGVLRKARDRRRGAPHCRAAVWCRSAIADTLTLRRHLHAPLLTACLVGFVLPSAVAAPLEAWPWQQWEVGMQQPVDSSPQEVPRSETGVVSLAPPSSGTHTRGPFPVDWEHLRFLRSNGDSIAVWAAVNVDASLCTPRPASGGWLYSLAMRYEMFDEDGTHLGTGTDELKYVHPSRLRSDQGFGLQTFVTVAPGTYLYRIEVSDRNRDPVASSVKEGELVVPKYDAPGPVLSDLAVASDTPGIWEPLPDVSLKLNAAHVVSTDASPFIYFEAYGLTPGGRYRVEVVMENTDPQDFMERRIRGAKRPFQLQYSGTVPQDPHALVRGAQHLKLGRGTLPGAYQVTVKVTDLTTGEVSLPRWVNLQVRSPDLQVRQPGARLGVME